MKIQIMGTNHKLPYFQAMQSSAQLHLEIDLEKIEGSSTRVHAHCAGGAVAVSSFQSSTYILTEIAGRRFISNH